MTRLILFLLLAIFIARAFWKFIDYFMEGFNGGSPRSRSPQRGRQMVRDPVCGTFVVPERAVTLLDGRTRIYFCSNACRDKYRARTA
jgi:uncharacterized protein